jgi:hypothetical protein
MFQASFPSPGAELLAGRSWRNKFCLGTRTLILQDRRGSLPDRPGDHKQNTLSGLAGELRCCDDEAAVMLISLSQHDAETSSWNIGHIWAALREHLFDLRKSVVAWAMIPAAEKMLVQGSSVMGNPKFLFRMNVNSCFAISPPP